MPKDGHVIELHQRVPPCRNALDHMTGRLDKMIYRLLLTFTVGLRIKGYEFIDWSLFKGVSVEWPHLYFM